MPVGAPDHSWMDRAACQGHNTEMFFPNRRTTAHVVRAVIRAFCDRCPVKTECGDYGKNERFGIWGGTVASERRERRVQIVDTRLTT